MHLRLADSLAIIVRGSLCNDYGNFLISRFIEDVNTRQLCSPNFKNIRLNGSHFENSTVLELSGNFSGKLVSFHGFFNFLHGHVRGNPLTPLERAPN